MAANNARSCIIGAFLNGYLIKMFGFRPTFFVSLAFMNGFIFLSFFGKTVLIQTVGQALCGYELSLSLSLFSGLKQRVRTAADRIIVSLGVSSRPSAQPMPRNFSPWPCGRT